MPEKSTPGGWRPRVAAGAIAVLVALAGCASPGGTTPEPGPGAPSTDALLPPAEGATRYPLTLTTWAGQTELTERPERIAVVGFSTNLDFVEAIEATPTYALTDDGDWEWRDPAFVQGIEFVDPGTRRDPINFEAIAATEPDLVIALNSIADESDFQRLSDIAPVLDYAEQLGDQADWREGQRLVGEALDLAGAAEEAIGEADQRVAEVVAQNPGFAGHTVTIATEYEATGLEYYTVAGGTAETFMTELGFEANPLAEGFVDDPVVADELLSQLDADVLVVNYFDQAVRESRESSELFQAVPAVASGRYVPIVTEEPGSGGNGVWVLRRGASALSVPWAAEVIAENWLADVDLQT